MALRIKICGLTRAADAHAAVAAGADALGFMFFPGSPRAVTAERAAEIIRELPPFVSRVGVFVNAAAAEVRVTAARCGLDALQFHGDETPEFCRQFAPLKTIKAFRIREAASLAALPAFDTDAWLLDSFVPGQLGGTGARFDWDLAIDARRLGRPVILAGGLNPENAAEAVRRVQPFGLDVSSGVESTPGCKDAAKVAAFIEAARAG